MNWPQPLRQTLQQEACVLVTMNLILGSAPRESGCRMIVTATGLVGSIGGGNLEFTAIGKARELLRESAHARQHHQPYGLGPALNQCCGGAVTLLFEVMPSPGPDWLQDLNSCLENGPGALLVQAIDQQKPVRLVLPLSADCANFELPGPVQEQATHLQGHRSNAGSADSAITVVEAEDETWWLERLEFNQPAVFLFGAGHVGQEVAQQLGKLPFELHWIDSRENLQPAGPEHGVLPVYCEQPAAEVSLAPPGSVFVVMTHSHQLDEDICFEILRREDFCWLGLIGSETKRRRFVQRLNKRGIKEQSLSRLNCPIGLAGISGKQPATIALSLAAQLMMEKPWMIENN